MTDRGTTSVHVYFMNKMVDSEGNSFYANPNEVLEIIRENGFEFNLKREQHKAIRQLFLKRDLLAVLPNGYGKSFNFQMLVLVQDQETKKAAKERPIFLLISPLVNIIKDQIVEIEALGLSACNLTENLESFEDLQNVQVIFSTTESVFDNKHV